MTIATLHPTGLAAIDLIAAGDPLAEDYIIDLGSLDLHESERLEIAYSESPASDGGEAISSHGPLVPVTFDVVVQGSGVSKDAARRQLLQQVQSLELAVRNVIGGTFEYKPDDLGAGVRSTFYHYVQSAPPKLRAKVGNNWDGAPVLIEPSNYAHAIELEVELQTQPFATSDPDSPVSVLTATMAYNQDDSVAGHVTIPTANVKGTESALTQLRIRNMVSGTWAAIGKLWYARRTEGALGNFAPTLVGGVPDANSSIHWSVVSDNTRRANNFRRYAPPEAANGLWAYRYYSISNIADHEGKAAIAVVCRSLAESREDWDLKAALQIANVIMETDVKNVGTTGMWTVCILGELDIPPTPISVSESYATNLYLYLRRNSGDEDNYIDIDFIQLLYVDEYVQQITIPDGFTDSYRLLLENFERELCHVVDYSSLALEKVAETLCPLLKMRPGKDNRIDFIWERIIRPFVDDMEDYEAWKWLPLQDCDDKNEWAVTGTLNTDTTYHVEGDSGLELAGSSGLFSASISGEWDFTVKGRFGDDDYVYLYAYIPTGILDTRLRFDTDIDNYFWTPIAGAYETGTFFKKTKKGSFNSVGSPDWSNITSIKIWMNQTAAGSRSLYFDDLRIAKADPDDATKGNDTGEIWDFMRDVWHIEEQDGTDKTLGCIDIEGLEQVALIHEDSPANIKFLAKVRAKRDNGEVGLVFRCADGTSGSEDMAAFSIRTVDDKLTLRQWAAGTPSNIATAVDQNTVLNTDYWLGVWLIDDRVRCYFGTTKAAIWDDEKKEFVTSARKFNVANAIFASGGALASGKCGLLSQTTLGRFDDIELYGLAGHVPGDTIQVEAKAIYQTIYPFRE